MGGDPGWAKLCRKRTGLGTAALAVMDCSSASMHGFDVYDESTWLTYKLHAGQLEVQPAADFREVIHCRARGIRPIASVQKRLFSLRPVRCLESPLYPGQRRKLVYMVWGLSCVKGIYGSGFQRGDRLSGH